MTEDGAPQEITASRRSHQARAPPKPRPHPRARAHLVQRRRRPRARELRDRLRRAAPRPGRGRAGARGGRGVPQEGVVDGDRVTLVGTAEGTRWTARMPEGREALLQVLGAAAGAPDRRVRAGRDVATTRRCGSTGIGPDRDRSGDAAPGRDRARSRTTSAAPGRARRRRPRELERPGAGAGSPGLRARRGAATSRRSASSSGRSPPSPRSRPKVPGAGLGRDRPDTHLAGFRRVGHARRGARTSPSTSSTRGACRRPRRTSQAEVARPARTLDATRRDAHRSARAERRQRGAGRRHGGLLHREPERPRRGARPDRPRVAQLLPRSATRRPTSGPTAASTRSRSRWRARASRFEPAAGTTRPAGREGPRQAPEGRDAAIQRALDSPFDLRGGSAPRDRPRHSARREPGKAAVRS